MQNDDKRLPVRISREEHKQLQQLADGDRRTLAAEAGWLIEQEANRRREAAAEAESPPAPQEAAAPAPLAKSATAPLA